MFTTHLNLFQDPHRHPSKHGRHNREVIKPPSRYNSSSNEMQTTSLNIITTAVALTTDKEGELDHSNKAPAKTNIITRDRVLKHSSNKTVAQVLDTTRISQVDDLTARTASERLTPGRLYEPSSSCNLSINKGGEGVGEGEEVVAEWERFQYIVKFMEKNTKGKDRVMARIDSDNYDSTARGGMYITTKCSAEIYCSS